jgi:hypothetical protein
MPMPPSGLLICAASPAKKVRLERPRYALMHLVERFLSEARARQLV